MIGDMLNQLEDSVFSGNLTPFRQGDYWQIQCVKVKVGEVKNSQRRIKDINNDQYNNR